MLSMEKETEAISEEAAKQITEEENEAKVNINDSEQPEAQEPAPSPAGDAPKAEKKKSKKLFGVYVMLSTLLLGVIASIVLSVVTLNTVLNLPVNATTNNMIISDSDDEEGETQENDVTIGESYEIKATTDISDAYKSGNTSALDDKQKETIDMADAVIKEVIKDKMTPFEKETAIYDWMTSNLSNDSGLLPVIPTTKADCDNPYGVLKYHNAVCVGYATTFRLFMEMLDIPCKVVHDTSLSHSWDLVQLDNEWYHTDIYMDVGSGNYLNFNMNDTIASTNHDWDKSFFPAAESLKYNMMYQSAKKINDIFKIPEMLRKVIDDKETLLSVILPEGTKEDKAQIAYGMIGYISESISSDGMGDLYIVPGIFDADGRYVVTASISYYTETPDYSDKFSEEDLKKFADAVNNAFGDLGVDFDPSNPSGGFDDDMDYVSYNMNNKEFGQIL